MELLVDTGNPCAIIIDMATMQSLRWRESIRAESNFGPLEGGWLRIAIPELGFDVKDARVWQRFGREHREAKRSGIHGAGWVAIAPDG